MAPRPSRTAPHPDPSQVVERLEAVLGRAELVGRFDPIGELVSCILSQNTADVNSLPAFEKLRQTYPTWEQVAAVPVEALADVIRRAGLANQKAKHIQASLAEVLRRNGGYHLNNLEHLDLGEATKWLTSLPGVGPKTAAIVLCFAFGRPSIPVDTHVHRVSRRLGFIPAKMGADKAHDELLRLIPGELAYRFHVALIAHGRKTCAARKPKCGSCSVNDLCPWPDKAEVG